MTALPTAFAKFDLTGKTAVVTGGGTGLGYFIARGLARSGAKVMISARRESVLKEAAEKLSAESDGNEVVFHTLDLASRQSCRELAAAATETLGGVDIFVGNAAQDCLEPLDQITDDSIDQMLQVNISANVELVRAFLPHMRANKWGRILFSSSAWAVQSAAQEGCGMYSAVKGALNAFTRTAAAEAGRDGITVNNLVLGVFVTDISQDLMDLLDREHDGAGTALYDSYASMIALGRWGRCEEVEGLVQLLASDAGGYITGASLAIDGGLTSMMRPNPVLTG